MSVDLDLSPREFSFVMPQLSDRPLNGLADKRTYRWDRYIMVTAVTHFSVTVNSCYDVYRTIGCLTANNEV